MPHARTLPENCSAASSGPITYPTPMYAGTDGGTREHRHAAGLDDVGAAEGTQAHAAAAQFADRNADVFVRREQAKGPQSSCTTVPTPIFQKR